MTTTFTPEDAVGLLVMVLIFALVICTMPKGQFRRRRARKNHVDNHPRRV